MEDVIKAEYDKLLAEIVLRDGEAVSPMADAFSWNNIPASDHIRLCPVVRHGAPVESYWSEFSGTLDEPPYYTAHGVDLPGVTCFCGLVTNLTMRLCAPVHTLAEKVFEALYRENHEHLPG